MPPTDEPAKPTYASGLIPHLPRAVLEERQRSAKPAPAPSAVCSPLRPPLGRPKSTTTLHTVVDNHPVANRPTTLSPSRKLSVPSSQHDRVSSPTKSSRTISTLNLRNDHLGTLVNELSELYTNAPSWASFVEAFRGRSYLAENVGKLPHPAAPLLDKWRIEGVPILSSAKPWTTEEKDSRFERGSKLSHFA